MEGLTCCSFSGVEAVGRVEVEVMAGIQLGSTWNPARVSPVGKALGGARETAGALCRFQRLYSGLGMGWVLAGKQLDSHPISTPETSD